MCHLLKKWTKNFSHTAKTSILSLYSQRFVEKETYILLRNISKGYWNKNFDLILIVGKVVIESKKRKLQDYSNIPEDIVSEASKASHSQMGC